MLSDEYAMKRTEIEIKLSINKKLFKGNHITEEMYRKAKEVILKETPSISYKKDPIELVG